jgi:hypothetical protein
VVLEGDRAGASVRPSQKACGKRKASVALQFVA